MHLVSNKKIAKNWATLILQRNQIYALKFTAKTGVKAFENFPIIFTCTKNITQKSQKWKCTQVVESN